MTGPLLQVRDLQKHFPGRRSGIFGSPGPPVRAVDGVRFDLDRGEMLALVGESGCGKSTLAFALAGLETAQAGCILFDGRDMRQIPPKALRRRIQMVFQDPYASLPPMMTVGQIVAEPLQVHGLCRNRSERDARVRGALEDAGLDPSDGLIGRRPDALSGGQRQRVVIASALVLQPDLLLADEPVSMLDVSVRAGILNLLDDLRRARGLAVLLITHDLSIAAHVADRIGVMYLGRIVEIGPAGHVLGRAAHPYTRALRSVVPVPDPRRRQPWTVLRGESPDPVRIPSGCRFHPRCPAAVARCAHIDPEPVRVGDRHIAACLLAEPLPATQKA